jgi:hypothetical protein
MCKTGRENIVADWRLAVNSALSGKWQSRQKPAFGHFAALAPDYTSPKGTFYAILSE